MKRLLWVGDAGVQTGFANATHKTLEVLRETYDVTVLGINYRGDPHPYPYPIYACTPGGDWAGVKRLIWMCDTVNPDVIVIQQDPWNFTPYLDLLGKFKLYRNVPVVGVVAVDGLNCAGILLNRLKLAIFWTEFGEKEARKGGYFGQSAVVPLGVDRQVFHPGDKGDARKALNLPDYLGEPGRGALRDSAFVVGSVGRNQLRKRLDLTIAYFAEWVKSTNITDACLFIHVAPTADEACQPGQLAAYYGIENQVLVREPPAFYGASEEELADGYRAMDVFISTTQGEGMGLPALEAMACGIPCILPDWAAYGDWARDAALLVPCTQIGMTPIGVNVVGGIADRTETINALNKLYHSRHLRQALANSGFDRACEHRFNWRNVGEAFRDEMAVALGQTILREVTA